MVCVACVAVCADVCIIHTYPLTRHQQEAEEAEKRRVAEVEAAAKAEAARAAAAAKGSEEGSDGGSEDNGGATAGMAEGSPKGGWIRCLFVCV